MINQRLGDTLTKVLQGVSSGDEEDCQVISTEDLIRKVSDFKDKVMQNLEIGKRLCLGSLHRRLLPQPRQPSKCGWESDRSNPEDNSRDRETSIHPLNITRR